MARLRATGPVQRRPKGRETSLSFGCGEREPADKDIRVVLAELGSPRELYAKYDEDADKCLMLRHYFTCFMDRLILWRFSSTPRTTTLTTSPTFTISLGWRRRRFATSEMCTRPS